jgi:hypothetical protein
MHLPLQQSIRAHRPPRRRMPTRRAGCIRSPAGAGPRTRLAAHAGAARRRRSRAAAAGRGAPGRSARPPRRQHGLDRHPVRRRRLVRRLPRRPAWRARSWPRRGSAWPAAAPRPAWPSATARAGASPASGTTPAARRWRPISPSTPCCAQAGQPLLDECRPAAGVRHSWCRRHWSRSCRTGAPSVCAPPPRTPTRSAGQLGACAPRLRDRSGAARANRGRCTASLSWPLPSSRWPPTWPAWAPTSSSSRSASMPRCAVTASAMTKRCSRCRPCAPRWTKRSCAPGSGEGRNCMLQLDATWARAAAGAQVGAEEAQRLQALVDGLGERGAAHAVDTLYPYCGLYAAREDSEINRVWRDFPHGVAACAADAVRRWRPELHEVSTDTLACSPCEYR